MKFIVWLLVCVLCVTAEEPPPLDEISPSEPLPDRAARFLNLKNLYQSSVETNEINVEKKEDPNTALQGLYTDCVLSFSLPCLQKKFLVFLDKLGRMDGFGIIGDFLSVKRTTKETTKPISEKAIEARMSSDGELDSLVEYAIDRFFNTHKLQLKLPFGLQVAGNSNEGRGLGSSIIDIAFPQGYSEGRGKKKKMMMMMMMMAKTKLAMLIPLTIILIKLKAVKALFFAKIALALSLFGALKKAGSIGALGLGAGKLGLAGLGGGAALGGGGGGYGGGGGGGHGGGGGGGGNKIVIIHDPHHATSGGGGGGGGGHSHGHSHGGGGGGGGDSYGPSGGGGGWSSGGGDSYSGGHDSGGWGRSWSPSTAQDIAYRRFNATTKT